MMETFFSWVARSGEGFAEVDSGGNISESKRERT
jgi:hypothetical protein